MISFINLFRCVHKKFLGKSKTEPQKLWTNAGAGGRAASIWIINNMNLITVVPSHAPPMEAFYDIVENRFAVTDEY